MELEPLNRSSNTYAAVMAEWLGTPNLSAQEAVLVRTLQKAANASLQEFDQMRRIAIQPAFLPTLKSAATKAIECGRLTTWNQFDAPIT